MRKVKWWPNERVDIPDVSAISSQAQGESVRLVRSLLTGEGMYVVDGFTTTAEVSPSSRVIVKLDTGSVLGSFIAPRVDNPNGLDHGVLVGNRDSSFLTEGQAQQIVDLSAQPTDTYLIEVRLVVTEGAADNRIFINPSTLTEFSQTKNTRLVYGWEAQAVTSASGGEWLPIASVVWGGSTISSGNITDTRKFLLEGAAPFQGTTSPLEDFNRSATRAANGIKQIVPMIRAVLRQISDIKGPNSSGTLDWFSRPASAPGGSLMSDPLRVKGLSMMSDTAVFTVGEGAEQGDFYGSAGLQDCLSFIVANKASLPKKIRVLLKTRSTSTTARFLCPTPVDLSGVAVSIEGVAGNSGNRIAVDFTHSGTGAPYFTSTTNGFPLELRGIVTTALGNPIADCIGNRIYIEDCNLQVASTASYLLRTSCNRSVIRRSLLSGFIYLDGQSNDVPIEIDQITGNTAAGSTQRTFIFLNVGTAGATNYASGVDISNSTLAGVSGIGASNVRIRDCRFISIHDDSIRLGFTANAAPARNWLIERCEFTHADAGTNSPHTAGSGLNGAEGTGWSVYCAGGTSAANRTRNVRIVACRDTNPSSVDAGSIRLYDVVNATIDGFDASYCAFVSASAKYVGVSLFEVSNVTVTRCSWEGISGIPDNIFFREADVITSNRVRIVENTFDIPANSVGLYDQSIFLVQYKTTVTENADIHIDRNTFMGCPTATLSGAFRAGHIAIGDDTSDTNKVSGLSVSGNYFRPHGGGNTRSGFQAHVHVFMSVDNGRFDDNIVNGSSDPELVSANAGFLRVESPGASHAPFLQRCSISRNVISCDASIGPTFLAHLLNGLSKCTIADNVVEGYADGCLNNTTFYTLGGTYITLTGNQFKSDPASPVTVNSFWSDNTDANAVYAVMNNIFEANVFFDTAPSTGSGALWSNFEDNNRLVKGTLTP